MFSWKKLLCLWIKLHKDSIGGRDHYHKPEQSKLSRKPYFLIIVCKKTELMGPNNLFHQSSCHSHKLRREDHYFENETCPEKLSLLCIWEKEHSLLVCNHIYPNTSTYYSVLRTLLQAKTVTFKELIRIWNSNKSVDIL